MSTIQDQAIATRAERARAHDAALTSRQALVKHRPGALWSLALSGALIMDGFYAITIGSFYGQTQFQEFFGSVLVPGQPPIISAAWQSGLNNGACVGSIVGLVIASWSADTYGVRRTMMVFLIWMVLTNFISVFAVNLPMLLVGNTLSAIGTGCFQTLTTTYASEVVPTVLRPYTTAWVCAAWGVGLTLSAGVIRATLDISGNWSWRLPFALQWVWPPILFFVAMFAPESPWNSIRRSRLDEARRSLRRLSTNSSDEEVEDTIAFIQHTTALERALTADSRWIDCFKGTNRRRTEINVMTWAIQILCGNAIVGYAVIFLRAAGFSEDQAFDLNIALFACQVIGGIISWWFMAKLGRATLYIGGQAFMCVPSYTIANTFYALTCRFCCLVCIGGLGFATQTRPVSLAIGILLVIQTLVNLTTTGPVCYPIVAETPSGPLRNKTITIGRIAYQIVQIIQNILTPRMLSEAAWNWKAKTALFFGGTNLVCTVWSVFRLPETKGRSFGEIDILFERQIPARKFKYTHVDQFEVAEREGHKLAGDDKAVATAVENSEKIV